MNLNSWVVRLQMRHRREIFRFFVVVGATQLKLGNSAQHILTTTVVIWAFFKVSLVGSRLGRKEIGNSKIGRRDEFNLHMNRLRWRHFGSIWLGRMEFVSSRLRKVSAPVRDGQTRRLQAEME